HPKLPFAFDAMLILGPEHARVFAHANWSRERVLQEINDRLQMPGSEIVRDAGGMAEGVQEAFKDATLPKFRPGGLLLVHAGGPAGLFSAIVGGWANGSLGSDPVTKVVSQ
ncbi:MAG: thioredoxin, partial [Acidimicrobiaceae bacterium]